ncbi:MAG: hypothetical protein AB7N76_03005 [Planctomycetota bacterium]
MPQIAQAMLKEADILDRLAKATDSYLAALRVAGIADDFLLAWNRGRRRDRGVPAQSTLLHLWDLRAWVARYALALLDWHLAQEKAWPKENWFDAFVPEAEFHEGKVRLAGRAIWGSPLGQRFGPLLVSVQMADQGVSAYEIAFLDRAAPEGHPWENVETKTTEATRDPLFHYHGPRG